MDLVLFYSILPSQYDEQRILEGRTSGTHELTRAKVLQRLKVRLNLGARWKRLIESDNTSLKYVQGNDSISFLYKKYPETGEHLYPMYDICVAICWWKALLKKEQVFLDKLI